MSAAELTRELDCFGSRCAVILNGDTPGRSAIEAVDFAEQSLLSWHQSFSRFIPDSELSRLNSDPRREVPVTPLMARFALAVLEAATMTGGLVDATLLEEVESAGYESDLTRGVALRKLLDMAPARSAAAGNTGARWRELDVDLVSNTVIRPPGLKLDSGGLAKGLFADILAEALEGHSAFAVNCAGDLRIGGAEALKRSVKVESPFDGSILHTFELEHTGVATSGIGRRSWIDRDGRPAHHLLDPATGRPAFTGIVQVTALAPSALLAEIHAKAAILSGPRLAPARLPHGGVIVFDDATHLVIAPPPVISLSALSAFAQRPGSLALQAE